MEPDQQEGGFCPLISRQWLEDRYGHALAQSIYEEILRADTKEQPANENIKEVKQGESRRSINHDPRA